MFENKNFCNIINTYNAANPLSVDAYDDNFNDYMPVNAIPNAYNEHLIPGRGYVTWPPASVTPGDTNYTINFEGIMNNGLVEVPVYKNNSLVGANTNLIGNPYPSAIDLDQFFAVNANKIIPVAYIWTRIQYATNGDPEPLNGPNPLDYSVFNYSVYYTGINGANTYDILLNPSSLGAFGGGRVLSSGQAFFIRTPKNFDGFTQVAPVAPIPNFSLGTYAYGQPYAQEEIIVADTLVFKNSMRTTALNNTFSRTSQNTLKTQGSLHSMRLKLSSNNSYDVMAAVVFKEDGASYFVENEDIVLMTGRPLDLYTKTTAEKLIIDIQDAFQTQKVIPLGIVNSFNNGSGTLTLSLAEVSGIFNSQEVFVYDASTQNLHNLSQSDYVFSTSQTLSENRLYLVFSNQIPTFARQLTENVTVWTKNNTLIAESAGSAINEISVFDLYSFKTLKPIAHHTKLNTQKFEMELPVDVTYIQVTLTLENGTILHKKIKK